MFLTKTKIATVLAAAMVAGSAVAAPNMTPQEEAVFKRDCTSDYMRFCSVFDPGTPQVEQCFQQRMKDLSPRCQAAIATYSKKKR